MEDDQKKSKKFKIEDDQKTQNGMLPKKSKWKMTKKSKRKMTKKIKMNNE